VPSVLETIFHKEATTWVIFIQGGLYRCWRKATIRGGWGGNKACAWEFSWDIWRL